MAAPIIPTDSPSIYAALNTLVLNRTALAIIRPNNPPPGIAGYLFNIEDDNAFDLESDITQYTTEDNSAVQDHIALRPETVSVRGIVAELTLAQPTVPRVARNGDPLPAAPGLAPQLTPGAVQTQAELAASQAREQVAVSDAQSLFDFYNTRAGRQPNETTQQRIAGYFYQLWKGRQLFTVETPWGFFTNMAISTANFSQGPDTKFVSEAMITFRKIRVATTVSLNAGQLAGRATFQQAAVVQNGNIGQAQLSAVSQQRIINQMVP